MNEMLLKDSFEGMPGGHSKSYCLSKNALLG